MRKDMCYLIDSRKNSFFIKKSTVRRVSYPSIYGDIDNDDFLIRITMVEEGREFNIDLIYESAGKAITEFNIIIEKIYGSRIEEFDQND